MKGFFHNFVPASLINVGIGTGPQGALIVSAIVAGIVELGKFTIKLLFERRKKRKEEQEGE